MHTNPNLRCTRPDSMFRTGAKLLGCEEGGCKNSAGERKVPVKLNIQYGDTGYDDSGLRLKYESRLLKTPDT